MNRPNEDRRIRRTRRLLKESLLDLMEEKSLSQITVADIAKKADVNRATFYLHYSSPAQLLESIGDDLLFQAQKLIEDRKLTVVGENSIRPVMLPIVTFIQEHRDLCLLLLAHKQESQFLEKLLNLLQESGNHIARKWTQDSNPEQTSYFSGFITYGLVGLLREWLESGLKLPQEQLLIMADVLTDGASMNYSACLKSQTETSR